MVEDGARTHRRLSVSVESLGAALATALTPDTADRARAVAVSIRTDGTDVAARLLLAMTDQNLPTPGTHRA